jgi:hypothetical protein
MVRTDIPRPGSPVAGDPLGQILAYWQALRAGRPAPARAEVDPRAIAGALDFALILEQPAADADGVRPPVRIRLAGRHVCALMGMELRAMPLHALIAPPDRDRFAALIAPVFRHGSTLDIGLVTPAAEAPRLSARLILLPLADDTGALGRALGGLRADGLTGAPPRRFALTARGARMARPPAAPLPPAGRGFDEPACGFDADPHPKAPHLRLVRTGG